MRLNVVLQLLTICATKQQVPRPVISKQHYHLNKIVVCPLLWGAILMLFASCLGPQTHSPGIDPAALESEQQLQNELAFRALLEDRIRIMKLGFRLRRSTAALINGSTSNKTKPAVGIYTANAFTFPKPFRETAEKELDLDESLKILAVAPDSPAEKSGVQAGDVILSVNGEYPPRGKNSPNKLEAFWNRHLKEKNGTSVRLVLERNGTDLEAILTPDIIIDSPILLSNADEVNALADGRKVIINRGLLRFVDSDTELAYVMSHELAHNLMKHPKSVVINYALGTLVDIGLAYSGVFLPNPVGVWSAYSRSKQFEAESDYLSLYILQQSGYELEGVPEFWRRMAAQQPGIIKANWLSTHPSSPERLLAMEAAIKEINVKESKGEPLLPETK